MIAAADDAAGNGLVTADPRAGNLLGR